jgi:hypothetical protein
VKRSKRRLRQDDGFAVENRLSDLVDEVLLPHEAVERERSEIARSIA